MAVTKRFSTGSYTRHVLLSGSRGKLRGLWVDADIDTETLDAAGDVTVGEKGILKTHGSSSKLGDKYPGVGLDVEHSARVGENLYVKKKLSVEGETVLEGPVTIEGNVNFPENVTFTNVEVTDKATIEDASIVKLVVKGVDVIKDVVIRGNLDVQGTLTKINTEDLEVKDHMVDLAVGSKDGDGGGFHVDGADLYVTWSATNNRLEINKDTNIEGKLTVKESVSGNTANFNSVTAQEFNGGTFSGSFVGDGSQLENVKAKIENSTVIRENIEIAPGNFTEVINSFNSPNITVSVYRYTGVAETAGELVYPKVEIVTDQSQTVRIHNPSATEEFRGYVVIANSGHIVNGQVDWVKYGTARASFSGLAGESILITHQLGTENVLVSLYTYVDLDPLVENGPKGFCQFVSERVWIKDENNVEITLPFDVGDGYAVIAKAGHVLHPYDKNEIAEIARVTGEFIVSDGTTKSVVNHNFNDREVLVDVYRVEENKNKYLYTDKCRVEVLDSDSIAVYCPEATQENPVTIDVVVGKAGHIVDASTLQLGVKDLDRLGVHYDEREAPCLGRSFVADERVSAEEIVGRAYVDTLRVGTKETKPEGGYGDDGWGSYIKFTDGTIENYIAPVQDTEPEIVSKLDNEGNLSIGGELFTKGVKASSDINLKNSIRPIESPLESLEQISGVKFTWNDTSKQDLGVIAQEVQKVYPELVEYTGFLKDSHATVSYNGLVAVLIEAVKELSHRVDNLEKKLENADRNTAER